MPLRRAFGSRAAAGRPGFEHAVDRRRADGDHVAVKHHKGEAAIALQRVLAGKVDDGLALGRLDPVIARDQGVVFVGFAVAACPAAVLARREREASPRTRPAGSSVSVA